jgi:hypothetical protein
MARECDGIISLAAAIKEALHCILRIGNILCVSREGIAITGLSTEWQNVYFMLYF